MVEKRAWMKASSTDAVVSVGCGFEAVERGKGGRLT